MFAESETVELKSEIVGDICKEIIAFANTRGGTLYIGIADDGTVTGVKNPDQVILQLNNKIRDSIKPDVTMFVHYESQVAEGKQIVAVSVQKGTGRPYCLAVKGLRPEGVFVRNGTSTDPATDAAIRRMIKETDGDSFETMRSLNQALTFQTAAARFSENNVAFDSVKMQSLGLISADGVYSNIALLLSDQCGSTIKAATFAGTDKSEFQDRKEFSGSLFLQMDELYSYLNLRNRTTASFEGLYRTDTRDYPEEALREALLNCLVHRDYSVRASTLVSVYDDRIEFVSVGGLPEGIELDDIMLGLSVCRNPKLAAIFYRLKLIEAYGTGMPKIMSSYKSYAVRPKVEVTKNAFKITLPNCNTTKAEMRGEAENPEERVLEYITEHGQAGRGDIDLLLGVSQSTANRVLRKMMADGLILQEGKGRSVRYRRKDL